MQDNIVGNRIRSQRKNKGLTQKNLADLVSVSPQVISNWERGYTPEIGHDDLSRLSLALSVTTDYLLGNDINTNQTKNETQPSQFSPDELALIEKYRKMKDEDKDTLHKVANYISPDQLATVSNK